jgi:hypothetical protein
VGGASEDDVGVAGVGGAGGDSAAHVRVGGGSVVGGSVVGASVDGASVDGASVVHAHAVNAGVESVGGGRGLNNDIRDSLLGPSSTRLRKIAVARHNTDLDGLRSVKQRILCLRAPFGSRPKERDSVVGVGGAGGAGDAGDDHAVAEV